ncbi:MAG: IPT/TIG domain-containing protein, partial [Kiritimatiellae bacterium]|nr:IPT/TIG domain-containing protein [Kiritimatiellia bacterium]
MMKRLHRFRDGASSFQWLEICFFVLMTVCCLSAQAAEQVLGGEEIPNALRITCNDAGMKMEAWLPESYWDEDSDYIWRPQTYADHKSSMIHYMYSYEGGWFKYTAGYFDGLAMTCTLNTNLSDTVNRRIWEGGDLVFTMDTIYESPSRNAMYDFAVSNRGSSVMTKFKFFHGQDTYLGGSDSGGGYWSSADKAVGVKKPDPRNRSVEIYQQMAATNPAAYRYCSLGYFDMKLLVEGWGNLGNLLNTNYYIDNGYALQWGISNNGTNDLITLNPGGVWTVTVTEEFKVGGDLIVTMPDDVDIGVSTVVTGEVWNSGDNAKTIYLSCEIDNTNWTAAIDGPTDYTLGAGVTSNVLFNVSCPPVVSVGVQADLRLIVTNEAVGESSSGKTSLTGVYYDGVVLVSGVTDGGDPSIAATTDFGGHPVGTYVTNVFTLTNAGPLSVTMTNYALTGDTAQFSVSGLSTPLVLAAGATTNIEMTYYYNGLGSHTATLTMQDNKPWTPFVMNLAGYTWTISTNSGPKRGGNEVAITNGHLGTGADINQVMVGGVNAEVVDQGTNWVSFIVPEQPETGLVDVKINSISAGAKTMKDCYFVNPIGTFDSVSPETGYYTGGTVVTITGTNFCNGVLSDVTNVTFQGIPVTSIDSVAGSTQVVVTVAAALPGKANIVIESFTHGRCELVGGFAFEGPDFFLYGKTPYSSMLSNEITNNAAPSAIKGSDYGYAAVAGEGEQVFSIFNGNAATLHISSITTNGANPDSFEVVSLTTTNIEQNEEAKLVVKFSPTSSGTKTATLIIDSDAPDAPFLLNLACEGVAMSPVQGPIEGGQSVTISGFALPGTVTTLEVGDQEATIEYQNSDSIRFTTPAGLWPDSQDVTLYGADFTNVMTEAYTYSRRGRIYGAATDDWTQWETLPDIPYSVTPRSNMWFMGVVEHEDYVYALGGTHTGLCKEATFYYDGFEWHNGPDLPFGWAGMALASQDDTLHLIGGYTQTMHHGVSSRSMGSNYMLSSWTFAGQHFVSNAPLNSSQKEEPSYMAGCTINDEVYSIGGCKGWWSGSLDIYRQTNIYMLSGVKTWLRNGGLPGFASSSYGVYHARTAMLSNKLYMVGGYGWTGERDAMTNAYVFDGTSATPIAGLPYELGRLAVGTVSGQVYAAGGSLLYYNSYDFSNRVYKLDGSSWSEVTSLRLPENGGQFYGGATLDDRFYAIGPISYAYPKRTYASGVSPTGCVAAGNVEVTISGRSLCDGTMSDVTSVLLAGTEVASIDRVSTTQIVVTAAAGSGAIGDVVVTSTKYGQTVASNAFTYSGIGIQVKDADGDLIVADAAASTSAGTDYGIIPLGTPVTNWLTIENTGDGVVSFSGLATNGSSVFEVASSFTLPATLAVGNTTNVPVVCAADTVGDHTATLYFNNDTAGASSNYPVHLSASVYHMTTNAGPFQGGQTITITNGVMGNGDDISAVTFGNVAATIVDQGSNWVQVVTPATDWAMTCDVTVHSGSLGDAVLTDAYTYREEAWIGSPNYSDGTWKNLNGPAGQINAMVMGSDGCLYAAGSSSFTNLCDGTYVPSHVAKFDRGVWMPVGSERVDSSVKTLAFMGTNLLMGGSFNLIGSNTNWYQAVYDGTEWTELFTNKIDGNVLAFAYDGTNLYLGGEFDYYGYTNVAVWDGSTLENIGNGITNDVYALNYHDGYLYAGTDGSSVGEFARYNGTSWQHLTTSMDDGVYDLAASGSDVYFGGDFDTVDGSPMAHVGQWDGSNIGGMASGLSNKIYALDMLNDGGVVAGYERFDYINDIPTEDNMAVWNGTSWVPCGDETAYMGTIYSLVGTYNGIYAGGDFYNNANGISNCAFFAFGKTNTISPKTGSSAGGTPVTIPGYNLGNGTTADVYRVTICGVDASIDSVSSTQIMVTTAAGAGGLGDVVVYTYDYGIITMQDGFTYDSGSGLKLFGVDNSEIANGASAVALAGTYGWAHPGSTVTNTLTIYNPGDENLLVTEVETNGVDAGLFDIDMPTRVDAGTTSNVLVRFSPVATGTFTTEVVVVNNTKGASSNFVVNLMLGGYTSTADEGPWDGEGLMTISNGTLGSGSDISSVKVGDYTASIIGQGANWVQFNMPVAASSSVENIYIVSDSLGETIIPNGYEYHKGSLWGYTNDWGAWEYKPYLPIRLEYASAAVYEDAIYAHGNETNMMRYSYGDESWELIAGLPYEMNGSYATSNRTLIVYGTNLLAIVGNARYSYNFTNTTYRFTGTNWVRAGYLPTNSPLYACRGGAGVMNDKLYFFGNVAYSYSNMVVTTNADADWDYVHGSGYPQLLYRAASVSMSNRIYSIGGLRSTTTIYSNMYEFNGTYWETNAVGLPIKLQLAAATEMDGQIYVMGGFNSTTVSTSYDLTNVYRYAGGAWESLPGLKFAKGGSGACSYHGQVYCVGGTIQENHVYAYPKQDVNGGVLPISGANTGGYQAVLSGFELCDGTTDDLERVTFGGADATVLSVAGSTQITVQVAGGPFGPVDVKVYSTMYGVTTSSNAFTFTGKDIAVLGTNGAAIATGEAASSAKGTDFGTIQNGLSVSRTFVVTNAGDEVTSITGIGLGGTAATQLVIDAESFPISLAGTSSTNLTVTWTADGSGLLDASLVISNNTIGPQSNYVVNLSASVLTMDRASYAEDGGGLLTISNGVAIGNGADITNVMFGTEYVTPTAQGSNWVTIVIPAGSIGTVSPIIVQSFTLGDTTLIDAFQYVAAGSIYGDTPAWSEMPGLPTNVMAHAAFVLHDSLYSVCGTTESGDSTNMYRFDGAQWHEVAGLPGGARAYGGGAVYSNAFYYMGGSLDLFTVYTNVYRFDGTNWTEVAGLPEAMQMMAAGVAEGKIVVAGGLGNIGQSMTNSYAFDGTQWTQIPGLRPTARTLQGSAERKGKLYSLGGKTGGGNATFNVYRSDGSSWASDAGLPALIYGTAGVEYHDRILALGGSDDNNITNGVWRFDGANWSRFSELPDDNYLLSACAVEWRGAVYLIGGSDGSPMSEVHCLTDGGVSPIEGYPSGGFNVTINGTNLSAGTTEDITSVTICGATAEVLNVYGSTQIVVTAGAGDVGTGDVVVNSTLYGEITAENAFTYKRGVITLVGTNGVDIAQDDAASAANGTDFGSMLVGSAVTNVFGIRNTGNDAITLSEVKGDGPGGASFTVTDFPITELAIGATGQVTVVCASQGGDQPALLS